MSAAPARRRPRELAFTENPTANELIANDWIAFMIGWVLDQQIRVQKAFEGPQILKERIGTLDAQAIASMPTDQLVEAFAERPVIHRFPGSMARRVQDCMRALLDLYDGDPTRVWEDASDYRDFEKRLTALPGFGKQKVYGVAALLNRRFGVELHGWEEKLPPYGSLSDVETYEDLVAYQKRKQEWKAQNKAAAAKG